MSNENHEVWITGIGFVSCFGEGAQHNWEVLGGDKAPAPVVDSERFAPYTIHPIPELDWSKQIARRGDQRQMENWQRLGTYTAGLALEDAGLKDDEDMVATMDLVVAAGGGERDVETDNSILDEAETRNDRDMLINERLSTDLRPTLFLAQLSNLLAGNISIVHKVCGSSRTYMGEESAGVTAIENAVSRIRSGTSSHLLVGGSFHADRPDALLPHELGHFLAHGEYQPVLARQNSDKATPGMNMASGGAFLVLESAEHAKARGAKPYAKLSAVASDLGNRDPEQAMARLKAMYEKLAITSQSDLAVVSNASGVAAPTALETGFLSEELEESVPVRHVQSMIGQTLEASFPAAIALSALALKHGAFFAPFEENEKPARGAPGSVLVTSIGHWMGEGMGLVEKAE